MNDMTTGQMGDNQPPLQYRVPTESELIADLRARYPNIEPRLAELIATAKTVPDKITDEETAGKAQALLKMMTVDKKQWGAARGVEKEPLQTAADIVFGFFKKAEDEIDKWIKIIKPRHTEFLEAKAAAERAAAEKKARDEREAAEKKAREAAELEERKRAAQEADEQARAAAEEAKANQDADEQRVLNARADLARARADRANARRDKDDDAYKNADARIQVAQKELDDARSELAEKRRLAREAQAEADRKAREASKAEDAHKAAASDAQRTERRADRMENSVAKATDADHSRTRGDHGTVGSLSGRWSPVINDRSAIPLETLRGYIHPDAIDAAITKFMRDHQNEWAGKRDAGRVTDALAGVTFEWVPEGRIV